MNGDSRMRPLIAGMEVVAVGGDDEDCWSIRCRTSAPPIEWPIRKSGGSPLWKTDWMNERISERTVDVGPVRPFCDGSWTERPQPRWSNV